MTREEDISYLLMGVLGVDITIAYGEGAERAFHRLMLEILTHKKYFLDLFNRGYKSTDKLIPSSISLYMHRDNGLNMSDVSTGTSVKQPPPPEPILVTHLGIRITLLLIPALIVPGNAYLKPHRPYGDFTGQILCQWAKEGSEETVNVCFNMLDRNLDNTSKLPTVEGLDSRILVYNFGVCNFGVDGNLILLPEWCFPLHLTCWKDGKMSIIKSPSDPVTITGGTPIPFKLNSSPARSTIPKAKLKKHGMHLMTLYL